MATTPKPPSRQSAVPMFTRREKYALTILSLSFIALSAVTHFVLGTVGESWIPHFKEEATPPPQKVTVQTLIKPPPTPTPTPKPTSTPRPTPTPPPQKNTPPPIKIQTVKTKSVGGTGPAERSYTEAPHASENGVPSAPPATPAPTVAPTVAPTAPPTPAYHPEIVVDAQFRNQVKPDYPEIAKQQQIQGTVVVLVTIGPEGNVIEVKISQSSGNASLDQAALKAAKASTYTPPLIDGKPATETYKVIYTFQLDT